MGSIVATITDPIALCAYVVAAIFGLLTLKWNPKSDRSRERQLFYFAVAISFVALFGGLFLAWHKSPAPTPTTPGPVVQSSSGNQSPNVNSSGSGSITVQSGTADTAATKPEKKK
jgi:hypothetical protein